MRVVIDYAYGNASLILPRILSNLGIEMIALNAFFDNAKVLTFARNRARHLEQLATSRRRWARSWGFCSISMASRWRWSTTAAALIEGAGCWRC